MDKFTVGSNAFFSQYEDFTPNDNDVLMLVDEPKDFETQQQIRFKGNCIFKWKRMSAEDFIKYHKNMNLGMTIGKFLVPDFANEIGLTIQQLKELEGLSNLLDERHSYEKVIFDSYIENNSFTLSEEQRLRAYNKYKAQRIIYNDETH